MNAPLVGDAFTSGRVADYMDPRSLGDCQKSVMNDDRPFIIHGRVATPQEARDIRNPMIQLFCFSSSGLIGSGYNTKKSESADEHCLSELESSMSSVQIEQKSY